MSKRHSGPDRGQWPYWQLLDWHLAQGTRPANHANKGKQWSAKEFADEINVNVTTVRNWRRNRARPHSGDAPLIEGALFGREDVHVAFRMELREAYRRAWGLEGFTEPTENTHTESASVENIARKTAHEFSEKLLAELDSRGFTKSAEEAGLERRTIIALAQRLKPEETLDFNGAVRELEYAVNVALSVIERGHRGTNHDAFVDAVLKRTAILTREGEFDAATKTLDQTLAEIDARQAEQIASFNRSRVTLLIAAMNQEILRRDAVAVARRVEAIATVEYPDIAPTLSPRFGEMFQKFYLEGHDRGINFSLSVSIEMSRLLLKAVTDRTGRASSLAILGASLASLGERESSSVRLQEAVSVLHIATKKFKRDKEPIDWARAQTLKGSALARLGERELSNERLEKAATAYRSALDALGPPQPKTISDWLRTQSCLANKLASLGQRRSDAALLEQAVTEFRKVLRVFTPSGAPAPTQWSTTQNDFGIALMRLGELTSNESRLAEAVVAFRLALQIFSIDGEPDPMSWAKTQTNLGGALTRLAQASKTSSHGEEAVEAHRNALKVLTRERIPLLWAEVQVNLAAALMFLAGRNRDLILLKEAIGVLSVALQELTPEHLPFQWAMAHKNLASALALQEELMTS